MLVHKTIRIDDQEVAIHISGEEAIAAILEEATDGRGNPKQLLMRALNDCGRFFEAVPDSLIAELSPEARELTYKFFAKLAQRYNVPIPPLTLKVFGKVTHKCDACAREVRLEARV